MNKKNSLLFIVLTISFIFLSFSFVNAQGLTVGNGSAFHVGSGTLHVPDDIVVNGTLSASTGTINVGGSWTSNGTFNSNNSTVNFIDGQNPVSISGNNQFYNLSATTGTGRQINFQAGGTQSVTNSLTLQGTAGNLLVIRSTNSGQQTMINLQTGAAQSIVYVDVKDHSATGQHLAAGSTSLFNSIDSGNNNRWFLNNLSDIDDDGMDDDWEILYFGSISVSDGTGDYDGDGVSDYDEFINGTAPAPLSGWEQVSSGGFGDITNGHVTDGFVFNGYFYVGTHNGNGGEVHRSADGVNWETVMTGGFGDSNNQAIRRFAVLNGFLYASARNLVTGVEIWRTQAQGAPPFSDWVQVNTNGFEDASNIRSIISVIDGSLYVTTDNNITGGEIWRSSATGGTPFTDWVQVNYDGFGDSINILPSLIVEYNGYLYTGSNNSVTGTQVWRTAEVGGPPYTDWEKVNSDGFGDPNNVLNSMPLVFNGELYFFITNFTTGAEAWKTSGAGGVPFTDWTQVNNNGFGDVVNTSPARALIYDSSIYVRTRRTLWSSTDGTMWIRVDLGQTPEFIFEDLNNTEIKMVHVFNGRLYLSIRNSADGGQIWRTTTKSNPIQITTDPASDGHPYYSPDGTKIVFHSNRGGNQDVWVMNADGSNPTQLTFDPARDVLPHWSPDASKIVFQSNRTGNRDIWIMDTDGSNLTPLTTDLLADTNPNWSPDGTKIAFRSYRSGNSDIWIMNIDGSNQIQLTTDPADDEHPMWSPDGLKLSFISDRNGSYDVWVMDSDGSNQIQLSTDPAVDHHPDWSPDGSKITFRSERTGNSDIYIMNADGSNKIQLMSSSAFDKAPDWHPDGTKIVFLSDRSGNNDIWVYQFDATLPPGNDVIVTPTTGIDLTFDEVLNTGAVSVEEVADPGLPSNFSLIGNAYNIITTAAYTGDITVCLSYDDTGLSLDQENNLQLLHFNDVTEIWEGITSSRDPVSNVICGVTDSLSPFAIASLGSASAANARFNWYSGSACYQVNFDGSDNDSTCSWDFNGEGSSSDCVTSFTFSSAGTKLVTLTTDGATRTMAVPAKAVNALPDTEMTVTATAADGMTLQVDDVSTAYACDASTALTAYVGWGDGTTSFVFITEGDTVASHAYGVQGTYIITYSTRDSSGNKSFAAPQTWTVPDLATSVCSVEGDITDTAILVGTAVKLMDGSTVVKMGQTDGTGHYSIPNVQAGKTYTIVPSRNGYEFAPATILLTLDCTGTPNNTGNDFEANGIW